MVYVLYVYLISRNCFSGISNILCQWKFITFPFSLFLFVSLCVCLPFFVCLCLSLSLSFSYSSLIQHILTTVSPPSSYPHLSPTSPLFSQNHSSISLQKRSDFPGLSIEHCLTEYGRIRHKPSNEGSKKQSNRKKYSQEQEEKAEPFPLPLLAVPQKPYANNITHMQRTK